MRRSLRAALISCALAVVCATPTWAQYNDTPSSADAIRLEPYTGELSPVGTTFVMVATLHGYFVYQVWADWTTPPVTITTIDYELSVGYGMWMQNSHGSASGFAVQAYPNTPAGLTARNSALTAYQNAGYNVPNDIYAGQSPNGAYHISISSARVASRFHSWQTLVFNGACSGHSYNSSWNRARAVLDYNYCVLTTTVKNDIDNIFDRMNGQSGYDNRVLALAQQGTATSFGGNMNTVLSPAIYDSYIPLTIDHRTSGYIQFDTPMDQSVLPWVVAHGDNGVIEIGNVSWTNSQRLDFKIIGRLQSSGTVTIEAWNPRTDPVTEGARSDAAAIGLDGDQIGPNGDAKTWWVSSTYRDDNLAALVYGFTVTRGGGVDTVCWRAEEHGTAKYLIEHGPTWEGPFTQMAEVPATGALTYQVLVATAPDSVRRLREVETDGDTLVQAIDELSDSFQVSSQQLVITPQQKARADSIMQQALMTKRPLGATSEHYVIFADQLFTFKANQHRDYWRAVGLPTDVVVVQDIGGDAGIKPYVTAHPDITASLLYGNGFSITDPNNQHWWDDPANWHRDGFDARPGFSLHPEKSFIRPWCVFDPMPQKHSRGYWMHYTARILNYFDRNNDGKPNDGIRFGWAPVADTVEAQGFNYKTINADNGDIMYNMSEWSYAVDASGNSGAYLLSFLNSLRQEIQRSTYTFVGSLVTTSSPPYNNNTAARAYYAKRELDGGVGLVIVSSTQSNRYHIGGYCQRDRGWNENNLVPNPSHLTAFIGTCGAGNIHQPWDDAVGSSIMSHMLFIPDRGAMFFWGPSCASDPLGNYWIAHEATQRLFNDKNNPVWRPFGDIENEAICAVIDQHPEHAELARDYVHLGDPNLVIKVQGTPVVGVGDTPDRANLSIYPNPAGGPLSVRFRMPAPSSANVSIFDLQGRRLATLMSGAYPSGNYTLRWSRTCNDGTVAANGLYVMRVAVGKSIQARKFVLLH